MSILFDTLRFQNDTHHGGQKPIVAEVGVIVDNIPTTVFSEDGTNYDVDLPGHVKPGYYYVAMISALKETKGVRMEDWGKRYFVSKESIFEYIYGYANENDPPEYIECYDRIADAVESDFLSFFLLMNKLIHESRDDRARINDERRTSRLKTPIETSIQIDRVDKINIVSKSVISENPYRELRFEITVSDGWAPYIRDVLSVIPRCCFKKCDENGNTEEEYPTLDDCRDSIYFSDFVRLAKATEEKVTAYFNEEAVSLAQRFTNEEIESMKIGILGRALGVRKYL